MNAVHQVEGHGCVMKGPAMSLSAWEQQALDSIRDRLAGSDPQLAFLLVTFTELASGEDMPVREEIRASSRWAVRRWHRGQRHRTRDKGYQYVRRMYQSLSLKAALLLWLLVTAALIIVAVSLSHPGGQAACSGSWATLCTDPASAPSSPPASHGVVVNHVSG
jgi:hypothetical protein